MHLNKQERAEHRARKSKEKRRERRRLKQWHDLQSRTYTDRWDEQARTDDGIEQYRNKINRDCGMFNEDFESGNSTWRKQKRLDTSD